MLPAERANAFTDRVDTSVAPSTRNVWTCTRS